MGQREMFHEHLYRLNLIKPGASASVDMMPSQALKTPQLYLIIASMMLACMAGLMMIAFAKPIAVARGLAEIATMGVFAVTLFNSFGSLFWGYISDKLGRRRTIVLLLALTSVLSLCVNIVPGYLIFVLIACIGFAYGGFLSTFPAFVIASAASLAAIILTLLIKPVKKNISKAKSQGN
jgi:OFA family oxalate/formate antiporter-like MFS transporter